MFPLHAVRCDFVMLRASVSADMMKAKRSTLLLQYNHWKGEVLNSQQHSYDEKWSSFLVGVKGTEEAGVTCNTLQSGNAINK